MTREEFEAWVDSKTVQMTWSRGTMPMLYADEVKELFDLLVPAWVPVSERLPEKNVDVYACNSTGWGTSCFDGKEWKCTWKVSHWMGKEFRLPPLPPLPAEEV